MPTTNTPRSIIRDVVSGRRPTKRLKSLRWVLPNRHVWSYGHHYPLVVIPDGIGPDRNRMVDGMPTMVLVNDTPSTATTNRHRRAAREAMEDLGYWAGLAPYELNGFTYIVYRKHERR